MDQDLEPNPFSNLVNKTPEEMDQIAINDKRINDLIQDVFLITLNSTPQNNKQLVFMSDVATVNNAQLMTFDLLEQALFERCMLGNPEDYLLAPDLNTGTAEYVVDSQVIRYLYASYSRNERLKNSKDKLVAESSQRFEELILLNTSTALRTPLLFEGQNITDQWQELLQQYHDDLDTKYNFLSKVSLQVADVTDRDSGMEALREIFYPLFEKIKRSISTASLITLEKWILPTLMAFVFDKKNPFLASLLIDFSTPIREKVNGLAYSETLIGGLLAISIMPKYPNGPYEFFDNPMDNSAHTMHGTLWNYLKLHLDSIHTLIKGFLLIGGDVREKMLSWIGDCLDANVPRGQIWNNHAAPMMNSTTTAGDGFMIGLCGIMLRLCQPLFKPQLKVLKVDPTYCAVPENERKVKGVHLVKASAETCFLPSDGNEVRTTADEYNFITDCFYMTHKALDLGYRVCIDRFIRLNREVHRLRETVQDTLSGGSDISQTIMSMLQSQMQQFLCLKTLILEPTNDQLLLQFFDATSIWLAQVSSRENTAAPFAPNTLQDINLPLLNPVPQYLNSIPEFLLENMVCYLTFIRHFEGQVIETDFETQSSIFVVILIFMGNPDRVRNPHLRARLAEGLESLLPKQIANSFRSTFKTNLFSNHPQRLEIIPNLLKVFVGIEMTGQSVQFEQKFNYRRPMYAIMDYLWKEEEHRECFKRLGRDAIEQIDAVEPPIFLRFINLLINDAIFLLDESLSNLEQIRTLQRAQDNGDWVNLPQNERQQNLLTLQHLGMMARFDNILGRDTINLLKLLTSEIKDIFCHGSMVDRVAAMLNYFLLHLVGPNRSKFKVKDRREFEFDPATTVMEIGRIYINLQESNEFCLAVSQDGRSYSHQLFEYAENVLCQIGGGQLIGEIKEFSEKVARIEQQQKEDQEALIDPPDEFLDPIMSTIMQDPVVLPSSKVSIDRTTIARHLLSDQTDPFNRSPLSMDLIKPDVELKAKIDAWVKKKREAYANREKKS